MMAAHGYPITDLRDRQVWGRDLSMDARPVRIGRQSAKNGRWTS